MPGAVFYSIDKYVPVFSCIPLKMGNTYYKILCLHSILLVRLVQNA
ncbi:hypothetical protein GGR35_003384 [Mucilaginibacter phyllosphaerae]|uniref:Uncharacterized protein n=1 Tax=Mucilaginibacter phyllosphaerae TaxID=1812349 RepID=A0ABR6ICH3_9SPHI|nr:hypothetical protein [Mucilaginibacter phyllosphaerae]